jgi:hypothetical protein
MPAGEAQTHTEQGLEWGRRPSACSVGFWVRTEDPEWNDWNSTDDTILALTTDGLRLVEVPEEYAPRYDNGDPVGDDPEMFWEAWSRIDPPRNDQVEQPRPPKDHE